jgi:hypothetical protein
VVNAALALALKTLSWSGAMAPQPPTRGMPLWVDRQRGVAGHSTRDGIS